MPELLWIFVVVSHDLKKNHIKLGRSPKLGTFVGMTGHDQFLAELRNYSQELWQREKAHQGQKPELRAQCWEVTQVQQQAVLHIVIVPLGIIRLQCGGNN